MAIDLTATFSNDLFLLVQLLGLLSQTCRSTGDLLGLFVDLASSPFQPRLIQLHRLPDLGQSTLPLDDLLAEGSHSQAMLIAGHMQIQFLLADALDLGLEITAQPFYIVAALAIVAMNLREMVAQLLARLSQAIQCRRRPRLQLWQLPDQFRDLLSACLHFGAEACGLILRLLPLHLKGDALCSQHLPLSPQ